MASPIIDFSHLTPEERIELAEQLWDSLEPQSVVPTAEQTTELRRRRAELEADGEPGEPAHQVLDEIAERGE
ncbi:MAG TPA: addiction module protein [Gemmatimonadaceae bacterium]|jgi:putative addiction module component, TIGR02574 family